MLGFNHLFPSKGFKKMQTEVMDLFAKNIDAIQKNSHELIFPKQPGDTWMQTGSKARKYIAEKYGYIVEAKDIHFQYDTNIRNNKGQIIPAELITYRNSIAKQAEKDLLAGLYKQIGDNQPSNLLDRIQELEKHVAFNTQRVKTPGWDALSLGYQKAVSQIESPKEAKQMLKKLRALAEESEQPKIYSQAIADLKAKL
jgi:hypothetical protein